MNFTRDIYKIGMKILHGNRQYFHPSPAHSAKSMTMLPDNTRPSSVVTSTVMTWLSFTTGIFSKTEKKTSYVTFVGYDKSV